MKVGLLAVGTGVIGLGLGYFAPAGHQGRNADQESTASKNLEQLRTPGKPASAFESRPVELSERVGRLAVVLGGSDPEAMLAELRRVNADRSLPPAFVEGARRSLVRRLLELGRAEDALSVGGMNPRDRDEVITTIIEGLAIRDPAAAEEMVAAMDAGRDRQLAMKVLLRGLGAHDRERGLEYLRRNQAARVGNFDFFGAWAKSDPRGAAEAAKKLGEEVGGSFLHLPVHDWARSDPDAAWAWIESQTPEVREQARHAYLNGLANGDPNVALEMMMARPELGSDFGDWIGRKLAENVEEAEAILGRVPPGALRTELIKGMTQALSSSDPRKGIVWAQTLLPGEHDAAIRGIFDPLGQSDPASAIDLALTELDGADVNLAIEAAAHWWAHNDPEGALLGLTEQLDSDRLAAVLPDLFRAGYSIVGQDLERWMKTIEPLRPDVRQGMLRTLALSWGSYDPEAVVGKIETLPAEDRGLFARELLAGMEDVQPEVAEMLVRWMSPKDVLARAGAISAAISYRDPAAAAQFVMALSAAEGSKERSGALQRVIRDWVVDDPEAAEGFVARLQPGKEKDAASAELARSLSRYDLKAAARVTNGMGEEAARHAMVREVARAWRRAEGERGRVAMEAVLISEGDRRVAGEVFGK